MFRYDIFDTHVRCFIFRDIGDDLTSCLTHGPQVRPHETVERTKETADPVPSLKVERSRVDMADPRSRVKTTTHLIEVVLL